MGVGKASGRLGRRMRYWPQSKIAMRLGRRGTTLMVFGLIDVLFGMASLLQPAARGSQLLIWPDWVWSGSWFSVAAVCFWKAWSRDDALAWAAAILIKWTYAVAYIIAGWSLYRGWVSGTFWVLFGFLVLTLSGMREDSELGGVIPGEANEGEDGAVDMHGDEVGRDDRLGGGEEACERATAWVTGGEEENRQGGSDGAGSASR